MQYIKWSYKIVLLNVFARYVHKCFFAFLASRGVSIVEVKATCAETWIRLKTLKCVCVWIYYNINKTIMRIIIRHYHHISLWCLYFSLCNLSYQRHRTLYSLYFADGRTYECMSCNNNNIMIILCSVALVIFFLSK